MDTIVYTLVTKGGGMDGMDNTDKGGKVTHVFIDKKAAEKCKNLPWCDIKPVVVDLAELADKHFKSLDPMTTLAIANSPQVLKKFAQSHSRSSREQS
jgi:hypothetical protein